LDLADCALRLRLPALFAQQFRSSVLKCVGRTRSFRNLGKLLGDWRVVPADQSRFAWSRASRASRGVGARRGARGAWGGDDRGAWAAKGERSDGRLGYQSDYYGRTLITRVGKLELRVPQDRDGRFSTDLFYQRCEQALVTTLPEIYVQVVSTRKVKAITQELCGHSFSASSISSINKRLDEGLAAFAKRPLAEPFPYLILDARYERVREAGIVENQAVLIAIGINWDGRHRRWAARDMGDTSYRTHG
jgi:hypothetical protein